MDATEVQAGPQPGQFQGLSRRGLAAARLLEHRRGPQFQSQRPTRREARVPRQLIADAVELQRRDRKRVVRLGI